MLLHIIASKVCAALLVIVGDNITICQDNWWLSTRCNEKSVHYTSCFLDNLNGKGDSTKIILWHCH